MQNIPITPYKGGGTLLTMPHSPNNFSRFSPATPDLEKGKGGLRPNSSLSKRFARGIRRDTSSSNNFGSNPGQSRRAWVLKSVLGLLLLLLIGNVIYLDIRLIFPLKPTPLSPSVTSLAAGQNAPQTSSSSSSVSAPPVPTADTAQSNQTNLALSCVSQFPSNAAAGAQAFCNQCMPALNATPTNFFPPGSQQGNAYTKAKVFCQTAFSS